MTSSGKNEETPEAGAAAAARSMVGDLLRTAATAEGNQATKTAFKCSSKGANESESECSDKEDDGRDCFNIRAKSRESKRKNLRSKRRSRAESVSSDDFEVERTAPLSARPSSAKGVLAESVDTKEALLRFKRERLEKQRAHTPLDGNKKKKTRGT